MSQKNSVSIVWFRQDLRLQDNPALVSAAKSTSVMPIYIHDTTHPKAHTRGAASRVWLHHALLTLQSDLSGKLYIYEGDPLAIFQSLCKDYPIDNVFWNRCYEPWRVTRDKKIKTLLQDLGVNAKSYQGSLLWEPWQVLKKDATPYQVFTPFYQRGCLNQCAPRQPMQKPKHLSFYHAKTAPSDVHALHLLPEVDWHTDLMTHWQVGEKAARKQLKQFCTQGLFDYKRGRDFPSLNSVSRLSPYLHFGNISPNQVWYALKHIEQTSDDIHCLADNIHHYYRELAWREFSYHLLYNNPKLPEENLHKKFNAFPWSRSKKNLHAWQQGLTGFPIVDAGMRELYQTGYMHNRVRMICASFLIKNCLVHWREGAKWFWDCLLDADLANNSASWQWVAGCGADAAPYFRIFNPILQSKKFDPSGDYIREFVPELASLNNKDLFAPFEAKQSTLSEAGIILGETYPLPIVDLKASRQRALDAYHTLKALDN